jgi:DNA-binding protein HU-beta
MTRKSSDPERRSKMGKNMTKSEIIGHMAEKTGMTRKQVGEFFDHLAQLAYTEAPNGFTLPGLGKLVLTDRAARMGRNPKTGEPIHIPAKKSLKFRFAKEAKDAIAPKPPKAETPKAETPATL